MKQAAHGLWRPADTKYEGEMYGGIVPGGGKFMGNIW